MRINGMDPMKEKLSTYRCRLCGKTEEDKPGKTVNCVCIASRGIPMEEIVKGIVTK